MMVNRKDFGMALNDLRMGLRVAREGWNGKGMWLELQQPDAHSKMTLPYLYLNYPVGSTAYPGGARVPWLASQTDMLADDWVEVDPQPELAGLMVRIGAYKILKLSGGRVWLGYEGGEGGEFREETLEKYIKQCYREQF